ncbi:MAG: hypothetical protein AAF641_04555 [Pseudomonadota bacterium]
MTAELSFTTPVGDLTVMGEDGAITGVAWRRAEYQTEQPELLEARAQITAYFDGKLDAFDLPLEVRGSQAHRERFAQK